MSTQDIDRLIDVARDTCLGDVRDAMLEYIRHHKTPLPFNALPEAQQREIAQRAHDTALKLVEDVVRIVAADGREAMNFAVKGVQQSTKGEVTVKLSTPFTAELWVKLGGANNVSIVTSDAHPYRGERRSIEKHIDPDQKPLELDAEAEKDDGPVADNTRAASGKGHPPSSPGEAAAKPLPPKDWTPDPVTGLLVEEAQRRFGMAVMERMKIAEVGFETAVEEMRKKLRIKLSAINVQFVKAFVENSQGEDIVEPEATIAEPEPTPPAPPPVAPVSDEAPASGLPGENAYTAPRAKAAYRSGALAFRSGAERTSPVGGPVLLAAWVKGYDDAKAHADQGGPAEDGNGEGGVD